MSFEEYGPFKVGGVSFPLALKASTGKTLLEDGDPGLAALLAYCAGVLDIHFGDRWAEAATAAGLTQALTVVGSKVPYDPGPYLTVEQLKFPILAAFPVGETMTEHTRARHKTVADIIVQWILPPLRAEQALYLQPSLRIVSKILTNRIEQGYDPDYSSGDEVFGVAGVASIAVKSSTIAYVPIQSRGAVGSTNTFFPCVEFAVSLDEVREDVFFETGLEGIDAAISIESPVGDLPIIDADIELT